MCDEKARGAQEVMEFQHRLTDRCTLTPVIVTDEDAPYAEYPVPAGDPQVDVPCRWFGGPIHHRTAGGTWVTYAGRLLFGPAAVLTAGTLITGTWDSATYTVRSLRRLTDLSGAIKGYEVMVD